MTSAVLTSIAKIWPAFYPQQKFISTDSRIDAIVMFKTYFLKYHHVLLVDSKCTEYRSEKMIHIDISFISMTLEFTDFILTLTNQPEEVIASIGIALSLIFTEKQKISSSDNTIIIKPLLYNYPQETKFSDIRTNCVGRLVSLRGYVNRLSLPKPIVTGGQFICNKCSHPNWVYFEDGIHFC
jgi:DNA replicative helicase MCM subunit Mcm2 (Cdc46/Mcm family)